MQSLRKTSLARSTSSSPCSSLRRTRVAVQAPRRSRGILEGSGRAELAGRHGAFACKGSDRAHLAESRTRSRGKGPTHAAEAIPGLCHVLSRAAQGKSQSRPKEHQKNHQKTSPGAHQLPSLAAQQTQSCLILDRASSADIFERARILTLEIHDTRRDGRTLQRKRSRVHPHMAHWALDRRTNNQRVLYTSEMHESFSSQPRAAEWCPRLLECPFVLGN